MIAFLSTAGAFLIAVFGFLFGRAFAETEKVLAEKRRVYEELLRACPAPRTAYLELSESEVEALFDDVWKLGPVIGLYGSGKVAVAFGRYLELWHDAFLELGPDSEAFHSAFKDLAKAQNDLILEMNRDALSWSFLGYRGPSRIPDEFVENFRSRLD